MAIANRILVIDDERPIRMALRRFLTRHGWVVEEAANGESGYAMVRLDARHAEGHPYAAVLSDFRMPGLNGVELYARLAQTDPDVLPRLVFSSGDVVSGDTAEFIRRTSCVVLSKPFEFGVLRAVIERLARPVPTRDPIGGTGTTS